MILTGCPIILPRESESVLLGAAILGAVAARKYASVHDAMKALNAAGQVCSNCCNKFLNIEHDFFGYNQGYNLWYKKKKDKKR